MDNIVVERLWRSVKHEEVYLGDCQSVGGLKAALKSTSPSITPSGPKCMMLAATLCWQRSHGGLCSERFAGNSRPIRVPWGIYTSWLPACGLVDNPSDCPLSAHTLRPLAHRVHSLTITDFYILFFLGIVLTKGSTSFLKLKIKGPHETKHFLSRRTTIL